MQIETLPLSAFKPDPRNPRKHSDRQVKQIAASISSFGANVPILIDGDNKVVAGHGRLLAARCLGLTELPAIRLSHLSPDQARAFAIADNRLTETSSWDEQLLGETLRDLSLVELDFSLEATGFSIGEIDLKIEGLTAGESSSDPVDQAEADSTGPAVTIAGDVWRLGRHRVVCGNALEHPVYEVLMAGAQAQIVFSDPPYNVPVAGHVSGLGRITHREFAMGVGELSPGQFTFFLASAFNLLARHSTNGSLHFICMDWRHAAELLTAGNQVYSDLKNLCVWTKSNAGMGSLYRSGHELIFVFKNGTAPHRNNVELGRHGRNRTNVWPYPNVSSFGRGGEEGKLHELHPTVKPVQLIADALLDASERGDIVLDAFLGSGSTLLAAERVGRICHGIELDPVYVDVAVRRWQRHTGEAAVHGATGRRFDDVRVSGERDV